MALCGVSAVIVAPVAEEFFFRGLFQSWLDSLPIASALQRASLEQSQGTQEEPRLAGPPDPNNPYSPAPSTAEAAAAEFLAGGDSADLPPAAHYRLAGVRWDHAALAVSSGVFALMHLGHGAAPIPLFFLALALGYLYQRTGRLLPSVTVHFCLNACSLAMLWSGLPVEIK
jgi:hypothetical protein